MSAVMLDQAGTSKLAKLQAPAVVLGDEGQFLGHFVPGTPPNLLAMEPPLSEEEQQRRESRTTGRTLSEIVAGWEKLA